MKVSVRKNESLPGVVSELTHFPEFVQSLLLSRGIYRELDLDIRLKSLSNPFLMKGMSEAVDRLMLALKNKQRILIVGDFDADGATSTALLIKGLSLLGFHSLSYFLPDRFKFGYGLSPAIVKEIQNHHVIPDVLVTVDNGISSVEGIAMANALGIDVIVTDHHLPSDVLPEAFAIVNPNQNDCNFEYKNLAGVGVAFHVLMALRQGCRRDGQFEKEEGQEPNLAALLDLVAIGTVADVVHLDAYNRILVEQGLARMRAGIVSEGIKALLVIAQKPIGQLTSQDIAFAIAPRINAAGRLDDMSLGVELLLASKPEAAMQMAQSLDDLNKDRKLIQKQMQLEAEVIVSQLSEQFDSIPRIICVYHEQWHQGVVGLIASQLKERFHRPVFAFAPVFNDEGGIIELKGSGRSIEGVHLRDLLDLVAKQNEGCLNKFGGHAMAAGLSLQVEQYDVFVRQAQKVVFAYPDAIFEQQIWVDGVLDEASIHLDKALLLERLVPWGQGLPEPKFQGEFLLVSMRVLAEHHVKSVLKLTVSGESIEAICFNAHIESWHAVQNSASKLVRAVYSLSVNRFRGQEGVQLLIDFIE